MQLATRDGDAQIRRAPALSTSASAPFVFCATPAVAAAGARRTEVSLNALDESNSTAARLQADLDDAEAELSELHDAYAVVWGELQQQRAATNAAAAQCASLVQGR